MALFSFSILTVQKFKAAFSSESHLPMEFEVLAECQFPHLENEVNNGYLEEFSEIRNYLCKEPTTMPSIQKASNKW